jgi:hypothetical protein
MIKLIKSPTIHLEYPTKYGQEGQEGQEGEGREGWRQ